MFATCSWASMFDAGTTGSNVEPLVATLLLRSKTDDGPLSLLTEREKVLRLMVEGMSDKGIPGPEHQHPSALN